MSYLQTKRAASEATGGVQSRSHDAKRYGNEKEGEEKEIKSRRISKSVRKHHKDNPRIMA